VAHRELRAALLHDFFNGIEQQLAGFGGIIG
jgi:hypothetical protein